MSAYFNSIHPDLNVKHDDVCQYVNDYLHYVAVIKGHSLQTAYNYYIDLKEFFAYAAVLHHLCLPDDSDTFDQTTLDLAFIKSITSSDIYEFLYMLQQRKNCKASTRNRKQPDRLPAVEGAGDRCRTARSGSDTDGPF